MRFSKKEVGHMTFKIWSDIFDYYKNFYDFKKSNHTFADLEKKQEQIETGEWLPDR